MAGMRSNRDIFISYVNSFKFKGKESNRKLNHSVRVSMLCKGIAKSLNLSEKEIELAELIGLVHDIGRFWQWEKYQTFDDSKSIDHALLGIEVLFENKVIEDFNVDIKDFQTIKDAVFYHNKYKVDNALNLESLIMVKIIRDADKADILCMAANEILPLEEDGQKLSEQVVRSFLNKTSVKILDVHNLSDKILFQLAFIFDLNFEYTKKFVKKERCLDVIYEKLEKKEVIKPYFEFGKRYL